MKLSTGLLFLAAVAVFLAVIFMQNSKFKAMLAYIYTGRDMLKAELQKREELSEEQFDILYDEFIDWVKREVDTETGETSVKFTMNEIRKRDNETFQLDLMYRFLEERKGEYEEVESAVKGLVQERGIYG